MKLRNTTLSIPVGQAWLSARLAHAPDVKALVVIVKPGSIEDENGREAYIAATMQKSGFATLTVDLLTHYEETRDPDARYNIAQLTQRLITVRSWIAHQPPLQGLSIGLISCDTATAASIRAAARDSTLFAALAARAGRADLAGAAPLRALATPLCMVVGTLDNGYRALAQAFELMPASARWFELAEVTELFIEPGALERFCRHAGDWFDHHLPEPQAVESDAEQPDGNKGVQSDPEAGSNAAESDQPGSDTPI